MRRTSSNDAPGVLALQSVGGRQRGWLGPAAMTRFAGPPGSRQEAFTADSLGAGPPHAAKSEQAGLERPLGSRLGNHRGLLTCWPSGW